MGVTPRRETLVQPTCEHNFLKICMIRKSSAVLVVLGFVACSHAYS